MAKINEFVDAPRCAVGDFNEITSQMEKYGGRLRLAKQMMDFRQALETNRLFDMGWKGMKYTWSNRHSNSSFTKLRLDRAVATKEWIENFGNNKVEALLSARSNHQPIIISTSEPYQDYSRKCKIFRFKAS